ncbi:LuxR C-terminal-related transcriptional regulator [Bradyrhizobium arachidis]|nr:LuxR C-terminal-related transcriptional regulator [Bradyrhizobium arachidis]UVO30424.1 LuxR C-terminal-related transcriptional regulator [Bradyrhizobium arachidis]
MPPPGGSRRRPDQTSEILRLKKVGCGSKRIARELGISRNTVKDYVAAGGCRLEPRVPSYL